MGIGPSTRSTDPKLPVLVRRSERVWAALPLLVAALALAGCRAQREIRIRTEPAGATVRLDQDIVGEAPLDLEFEHYGVRRVTAYLDGYRTESREVEIKRPWYSIFPLDLISEVLLPFGWADVHRIELELEPEVGEVSEGEFRAVLERAEELRRGGPAGPQPVPAPPAEGTPAGEPVPPGAGAGGGSE